QIRGHRGQAEPRRRGTYARARGDVCEGPVSVIVVEHRAFGNKSARAAIHRDAFEIAVRVLPRDIDLSKPHHEEGWKWNSRFQVAARIDHRAHVWFAAMRIPFSALDQTPPTVGNKFRVNLFRSQGPDHKLIVWQPTMSDTFHVPE